MGAYKAMFNDNNLKQGFPKLYEYGHENGMNYTVWEMCGPNLAQLSRLSDRKFSKKTISLIALQIIDRI